MAGMVAQSCVPSVLAISPLAAAPCSRPVRPSVRRHEKVQSAGHVPLRSARLSCVQQSRFRVSPVVCKASTGNEKDVVIPDPDFRLAGAIVGIAALLAFSGNELAAAPVGLLGVFLGIQTTRVKFRFDKETVAVVIGEAQETGDNVFVGGDNRWKFSTFTNWEFWWPSFPVLVYFKETQTRPEGQIHFFPIIFNGKQLYDLMVERCGPSQNSAPK